MQCCCVKTEKLCDLQEEKKEKKKICLKNKNGAGFCAGYNKENLAETKKNTKRKLGLYKKKSKEKKRFLLENSKEKQHNIRAVKTTRIMVVLCLFFFRTSKPEVVASLSQLRNNSNSVSVPFVVALLYRR